MAKVRSLVADLAVLLSGRAGWITRLTEQNCTVYTLLEQNATIKHSLPAEPTILAFITYSWPSACLDPRCCRHPYFMKVSQSEPVNAEPGEFPGSQPRRSDAKVTKLTSTLTFVMYLNRKSYPQNRHYDLCLLSV